MYDDGRREDKLRGSALVREKSGLNQPERHRQMPWIPSSRQSCTTGRHPYSCKMPCSARRPYLRNDCRQHLQLQQGYTSSELTKVVNHGLPRLIQPVLQDILALFGQSVGNLAFTNPTAKVQAINWELNQIVQLSVSANQNAALALSLRRRELPNRLIQMTKMSGTLYNSIRLLAAWCFLHFTSASFNLGSSRWDSTTSRPGRVLPPWRTHPDSSQSKSLASPCSCRAQPEEQDRQRLRTRPRASR